MSASDAESGHGALDAQALAGARLLLVEDNPVNMMIGVALLEQWGAQVVQAENGALAIDLVARSAAEGHLFDAVLMDVQMPGHERPRGHAPAARALVHATTAHRRAHTPQPWSPNVSRRWPPA